MTPVQTIPGVRVGRGDYDKPVKTYPANRVCKHRGCRTRISIYNSTDTCSMHSTPTARASKWQVVDAAESAKRIWQMRRQGMSLDGIAQLTGVSRDTLGKITGGVATTIRVETARKILEAGA